MPNEKQSPKELKVTDRRIFTADGEIRDEFKEEIRPAEPQAAAPAAQEAPEPPPDPAAKQPQPSAVPETAPGDDRRREQRPHAGEDRRTKTMADKATNPGTPFTAFIEPLIAQAYMSLGLLRNPYQPQTKLDLGAARQMIEILALLKEKTAGNLTDDEADFLNTHLGELKLAFVQKTKSLS